jgi:hypothetical protein
MSNEQLYVSQAPRRSIPWQIWVVVVMLALEGIGNVLSIPELPAAAIWAAAKCLFIVGLTKRWKWVFVIFLVVASIHVLYFSMDAPFVAFLNLILVILVGSKWRYYFPVKTRGQQVAS